MSVNMRCNFLTTLIKMCAQFLWWLIISFFFNQRKGVLIANMCLVQMNQKSYIWSIGCDKGRIATYRLFVSRYYKAVTWAFPFPYLTRTSSFPLVRLFVLFHSLSGILLVSLNPSSSFIKKIVTIFFFLVLSIDK